MPSIPYASLGFVGYVKFKANKTFGVRATSCDLKLSQAIEKPEVVTGKFDRTVYKLGPKEVGGSVAFPAVLETVSADDTTQVMDALWELAVYRDSSGRLKDNLYIDVRYAADNSSFTFERCLINSFKWSVTQGDLVNVETDIIGRKRAVSSGIVAPTYATRNTRAATWADVNITVEFGGDSITGEWIRSFEATINNNVERFYTCNGELNPQDIAAKMREITGTMTLMGRNAPLGIFTAGTTNGGGNESRCNENNYLRFGYQVANNICNATWFKKFCGVVYEIETMSLSNDIVESSINWHALPGGAAGELFDGDSTCVWNG